MHNVGTVIRCTKIHPYVIGMNFQCTKCETVQLKVFLTKQVVFQGCNI